MTIRLLLLRVSMVVVGLAVFSILYAAFLARPSAQTPFVRVEIPEGADTVRVADIFVDKKILSTSRWYRWYAYLDPLAAHPRPGIYSLRPHMSYRRLASALAFGPSREETEVTMIEGWTIRDLTEALAEKGMITKPGDFAAARFVDEAPFLANVPGNATLEGYLFPDTYRVWKDEVPDSLIHKQLAEFAGVTSGYSEEARAQGHTLHEIVTMASLVEKEVRTPEEKKIVAGIFWNRIKDGIPLQSDATLNYVIGAGRDRATAEDLKNESPYNTYKVKGLPPGPIGNPGKDALEAALHPTNTAYRYFLTDKQGRVYYARTLQEHIRNRTKAFGSGG